jgi:hypothetical protein
MFCDAGFREHEEGRGEGWRDGGSEDGKNSFGNDVEKSYSKMLKDSFNCRGDDREASVWLLHEKCEGKTIHNNLPSVLASEKVLPGDIWEPIDGNISISGVDDGE